MNLSSLTLYAGTKWSWKESYESYPAPTYSLKIYLKLKSNPTLELVSTPDGTSHSFVISQETTNILPGVYQVQVQAFDNANLMYLVETGPLTVLPNLSVADDSRGYWEQIADEAKAAYKTLVNQVADSITLSNGKTITFAKRAELLKIINNAEIKAGLKSGKRRTLAKFINPQEY